MRSELPVGCKLDAEMPCKLQTKLRFQVLGGLVNYVLLLLLRHQGGFLGG